jgi:predicted double-glycine peptidase
MGRIIDFPEVRQSTNYTCGVSALQAVLYYYGVSYNEHELEVLIGTTYYGGTTPVQIINFCRSLGFLVNVRSQMTIKQLETDIDQKIPIIVVFQAWDENPTVNYHDIWVDGHYSVVIGYNTEYLFFEDPSIIGKGKILKKSFLKRWHDIDIFGHKYVRFGITIYGKKIKYNSHKIIPIL